MKKVKISIHQARQLAIQAQLLQTRRTLPQGKEAIAETIDKLGYIQIDTIATIKRSHHHTLWTRCPDYNEDWLHELQAVDRRIFEYWGHAMSYLPMADYRYCLPRMGNFHNPTGKWARHRLETCGHLMEPVLQRIRGEGPLSSKDFENTSGRKAGTWWDWKPAKFALELLFWRGDLMITKRRNFQKIYDLTERVLPEDIDTTMPSDEELGQFFVRHALSALGVAEEKEIVNFMQPDAGRDSDLVAAEKTVVLNSLSDLIETGEIIPVKIEDKENGNLYAQTQAIETYAETDPMSDQVFLLSPFDNLIIGRERTRRLFNFDYSLECYLPVHKRKYGYFVLPVLSGNRLVGRFDPKADRKTQTLVVHNLVFEEEIKTFDELLPDLGAKLADFVRFNDCKKVLFQKTKPASIKTRLKKIVKQNL